MTEHAIDQSDFPSSGSTWRLKVRRGAMDAALGAIPFVLVAIAWYLAARSGRWSSVTVPDPGRVLAEAAGLFTGGLLQEHLTASLWRLVMGLLVAILMGFVLGLLMGMNRIAAELLDPVVTFMNAISGVAWIPLAIVWFGVGRESVLFVIWNSVFFMVLLNTILGVHTADKRLDQAVRTLGASRFQRIWMVTIPAALPNVLTGIRLGHAFGWRALIAAEMIGATSGVGFFIFQSSSHGLSYRVFAGILVIGVTVLLIDRLLIDTLERRTVRRWGQVHQLT